MRAWGHLEGGGFIVSRMPLIWLSSDAIVALHACTGLVQYMHSGMPVVALTGFPKILSHYQLSSAHHNNRLISEGS